jgi:thioredoxin-related protein
MNILTIFFFLLFNSSPPAWSHDFESAQQQAKESHKLILVNFSGSDWCMPCMKMKKNIFESEDFSTYAGEELVLVNVDFPRSAKNRGDKNQVKKNEILAEKYNPKGGLPYTILMNSEGKVLKAWEGYENLSAKEFVSQIKICQ